MKYLCIHGHFYQPPRENPWLETVELQDSAAPYHDWNDRITAECYGRNTAARMMDEEGRIDSIVNNYSKISFNFGPTLLAWMKERMPWVHDAIVEADKLSQKNFSGHGSALAQVYNHMILPLANTRDKQTQVIWGIRDFEARFGRKPEGMWLSETAADTPTLETLAECGIKFTILSPYQASKVKEPKAREWKDVNGGNIDPARPYIAKLPSGRSIALFFYDAPVSQAVAFEKLLDSGEKFANRLLGAFPAHRQGDQLVHIATDGESYGHHHRFGEMALAYALKFIESEKLAKLTNYGEFLEKHSPTHEVQIHEKSAWSCPHGVGRWMEDCGCNAGGRPGWNQSWRAPLRHALDWLRDEIAPLYERAASELVKDPWEARDDYIAVLLDRSDENVEAFFARHAVKELGEEDKTNLLKLLEMQRHAMLMYTSCGWFFDELSGLETVQVIQYAARAIQLGQDVLQRDLESGFLDRLSGAKSNIPEHRDGRNIYKKFVKPAMISWDNVVAHYAISSIFDPYEKHTRIFLYSFEEEDRQVMTAGSARLVHGRTTVRFDITRKSQRYIYAALHMGEHQVTAGVKPYDDSQEASYAAMARELRESFERANFPEIIRVMDHHLGPANFSMRSLFRDEQRKVLNVVLTSARQDLEGSYRSISERYTFLIRFLKDLGTPLPQGLRTAAEFTLHVDILRELQSDQTELERLSHLLEGVSLHPDVLDDELSLEMSNKLLRIVHQLQDKAGDVQVATDAARVAEMLRSLPLDLNLWRPRNFYWKMLRTTIPEFRKRAQEGDENAKEWLAQTLIVGEKLGFAQRHLS